MINKPAVKLIRSSTMKCRLNKDIKLPTVNLTPGTLGEVIYTRQELEGELALLDDFSIAKQATQDSRYLKNNKLVQRFKTPISIRWDITYQCNLKCRHCYSACSSEGKNVLTTFEAKKMLDAFDQAKVQFVQILGGEPMVRPDIYELVAYALTKKFIFSLNSNGYLLNQAAAQRLAKLGLQYIQISLHGFAVEHDYLTTRPGSFKKAVAAIHYLTTAGVRVSVSCTVSDINFHNILKFVEYLIESGVKSIQLLTPLEEGRAKTGSISLAKKHIKSLKAELIKMKHQNPQINIDLPGFDVDLIDGLANNFANDPSYEFMFGCSGGVSSLRIDPEGRAAICVGAAGQPLGNLLTESIPAVMKKMYQWRLKNRPKLCLGCDYYLAECQGGCYLRFK